MTNAMSELNHSETRVWCRIEKREKTMAAHKAVQAVARGLADLVGHGCLPVDKTIPPGARTLGDGAGHAFVVLKVEPGAVVRLRLDVAQRVVLNGMGLYTDRDGVPLRIPVEEETPTLIAETPIAEGLANPAGVVSRLRQFAERLGGGLLV
jgi:hypothetical protein